MTRTSVEVLPIRVAHIDRLDGLGGIHRDPFNRMLVAQALAEDCDARKPGIPVAWD